MKKCLIKSAVVLCAVFFNFGLLAQSNNTQTLQKNNIGELPAFKTVLDPFHSMGIPGHINYLSFLEELFANGNLYQKSLSSDLKWLKENEYKSLSTGIIFLNHNLVDVDARTLEWREADADEFKVLFDPTTYRGLEGMELIVNATYFKRVGPVTSETNEYGTVEKADFSVVDISFFLEYKIINNKLTPVISKTTLNRTIDSYEFDENGIPLIIKILGGTSSVGG